MPLKLVPPRKGKSPNWSIRGTYLKVSVDRSTGTDRRSVAAKLLRDLEERIERGDFPERAPAASGPTFLTAAVAYLKARPQKRKKAHLVGLLIKHFGETPLSEMTQEAIDAAAIEMYPNVSPASRNAYVYTPVSAILHHAGLKQTVHRPKGYKGRTVTDYLNPEDAFAIVAAADKIDREFGLILRVLLYTGARVGEILRLRPEDVRLDTGTAWVSKSKNGLPRTLKLREDLCAVLASHVPASPTKFFRWRQGGRFGYLIQRAKLAALGITTPRRAPRGWRQPESRFAFVNYHTFRHTWATWMRQYGGADVQGLVATGNWSDVRSAQRYAHVVARDEWARVDDLPAAGGKSVELKRDAG